MKELEKLYDPARVEDDIYAFWLNGGYFHTKADKNKKPYTIVMPPPNVTGQLHMGHAMDETWQDILIRYKRMQGYAALWVPGTDHASIATEAKVVAKMKEEGLTKEMLGREGFLERAWAWKNQYGDRIVSQLKKLGCSCDWDRERFTMDEGCSKAVLKVFKYLYDKDLIYRGERIINWCPHCKTSISDAEVEYEDQEGSFWHLKYPIVGTDEFLVLATTRPETMLGDTAVAIHPDDERYKHLHGKKVLLPLLNKEIPIVTDTYVDMEFGTGVVKITPAHDPNDFEVGQRHNLPIVKVLDETAHMTADCGKYAGMDRYEARKAIVADLEAGGYLEKIEPHAHNVGTCYRCGTTIEPMVSKQWFVRMVPLAGPAIDAVRDGRIKFVPERFDKQYYHWMENTRDWCISRQLWWGHRIPAYYCDACGEVHVSDEPMTTCPKCGGALRQDEDTLDTWFSSALWPFSTLGWPDKTEDLDYFYPTNTLVTGYDIITFWVSRMIFSGLEYTGKVPFDTVLIHGLVRDAQGRKMSKSLGNGIDPLEIIAQYGADALRLTLVLGSTPGNDMRFSDEKIKASRNFANKLWNATRFVMMNLPEDFQAGLPAADKLDLSDKWILSTLNNLARTVTDNLDKFELGLAAQKVQDFIWEVYCDWYIEIAKVRLNSTDPEEADNARKVLVYVLTQALKLLHPFMPFITEEIYRALPGTSETIMTEQWPVFTEELNYAAEEADFEKLMDYIKAVRTIRAEMNVHPAKRSSMIIETSETEAFHRGGDYLAKFAFATDVTLTEKYTGDTAGMVQVITHAARGFIPMMELIDREKELARLNKEKAGAEKEIGMFSRQLSNEGFVNKAPANVVEEIRQKLARAQEKLARVEESIAALG
ncbi:valine--tRNA ligase [Allofournierella massiliensis]|uniref:Valine--tRNA ligase n=1 Tax=Allofournierella massiliensis TaxID=1650663 RepID=A0ABT7UU06_9FIRM|nr:valine--tRNA ligase [Fournierella massiliensis]MDM8202342.1 valine--tRNA ligase [Fournierella massiliensis]